MENLLRNDTDGGGYPEVCPSGLKRYAREYKAWDDIEAHSTRDRETVISCFSGCRGYHRVVMNDNGSIRHSVENGLGGIYEVSG